MTGVQTCALPILEGMKYFCTSAAGLIADITPDPTLQNVLAGSALLYGGLKDVSTFYEHAMIKDVYKRQVLLFLGIQAQTSCSPRISGEGSTVPPVIELTQGEESQKYLSLIHIFTLISAQVKAEEELIAECKMKIFIKKE